MNNKERKQIAKKIAECEKQLAILSEDDKARINLQETIMHEASKVKSFEDMVLIDEMVQNLLDN